MDVSNFAEVAVPSVTLVACEVDFVVVINSRWSKKIDFVYFIFIVIAT